MPGVGENVLEMSLFLVKRGRPLLSQHAIPSHELVRVVDAIGANLRRFVLRFNEGNRPTTVSRVLDADLMEFVTLVRGRRLLPDMDSAFLGRIFERLKYDQGTIFDVLGDSPLLLMDQGGRRFHRLDVARLRRLNPGVQAMREDGRKQKIDQELGRLDIAGVHFSAIGRALAVGAPEVPGAESTAIYALD